MPLNAKDYKGILAIIEALYSAGSRDELFPIVFGELFKVIPVCSAVHVPMDPKSFEFKYENHALHNLPDSHLKLFLEHYQPLHPYGQSGVWKENINMAVRLTDVITPAELAKTEYCRNFMSLLPIFYELDCMMGSQGDPIGIFGLHRKKRERNFNNREKEIMDTVLPHLSKAVHNFNLLDSITGAYGIGIIEVGKDGKLHPVNYEARRILAQDGDNPIPDPGLSTAPVFYKTKEATYRVRSVLEFGSRKTIIIEPLPSWNDIEKVLTVYGLTNRQKEIAYNVVRGLSNMEIADRLSIAEQTVKEHVRNILEIVKVRNRTELTANILGALILNCPERYLRLQ